MADDLTGHVTRSAADIYEEFFVPALFREWAQRVADAAQLAPSQKVLDVACGTGVLACEAARRVHPAGTVIGLDRNDGMLAVARNKGRHIDWRTQPGLCGDDGLLQRLFGDRVADALRTPFALGDPEALAAQFVQAGISAIQLRTVEGAARFPSIESWVHTDVKGWTLADLIDDAQYVQLPQAAQAELTPNVQRDGTVAFGCPAHIVIATKP